MKKNNRKSDIKLIRRTYEFAKLNHGDQLRKSGEPYIIHPIEVATILAELGMDTSTIVAGLLHDVIEDTEYTYDDIKKIFGEEVANLVSGVTKITKMEYKSKEEQQADNFRKMLLAMADDIRVIIIKLADRLHNMRTLKYRKKEKQKKTAMETLDIYAPLAHRLGISKIKWELEDLSFRYIHEEEYYDLVKQVAEKRAEREIYIKNIIEEMYNKLEEAGIDSDIDGRPKHFFSIYKKMVNKNKSIEQIFDLTAIRVLVNTVKDCYEVLGIVHTIYKPIPGRFKDYIAMPKPNMYQSLHTTVFGIDGQLFEIQIRTYEMDKIAEYGIASHWSYKENKNGEKSIKDATEQKLQIFRNIIELNEDSNTSEEFVSSVKKDILTSDVIYVYTPKGDVIELPVGSTPVDFAYKVHSEVGDRIVGAIVNDNIVPLDYKLVTGDIIKVNTNKASKPSKDWLNFVVTSGAKNKIKSYYSKLEKDENIEKGTDLLEKELRKENLSINEFLSNKNIEIILNELKLNDVNDIYINIATGKNTPNSIIKIISNNNTEKKDVDIATKINETTYYKETNSNNDVLVEGISEIKTSLSSCCKPIPGDNIIGYITRGSGITVHRSNCHNITDTDERLINVKWNVDGSKKFPTDIIVYTNTNDNLLDIISKASSNGIIVDGIVTVNKSDTKIYSLTILVENTEKLDKFIASLSSLSFVIKVERLMKKCDNLLMASLKII